VREKYLLWLEIKLPSIGNFVCYWKLLGLCTDQFVTSKTTIKTKIRPNIEKTIEKITNKKNNRNNNQNNSQITR